MSYDDRYYTVKTHRYGHQNKVTIWVREEPYGISKFSRTVCMKECFWHIGSPLSRYDKVYRKALAKAENLNSKIAYVNHDIEIAESRYQS